MKKLSACFTGHRASKMPYSDTSKEHEQLEKVLKEQILELINKGVTEFYTGGQNGIDELAALLVLCIADKIDTEIHLHLVLPYEGINFRFTDIQKVHFSWIKSRAKTVTVLNKKNTKDCFRQRNQYMVDRSDYLIAVQIPDDAKSGTQMTKNMAKKKGIPIININPLDYSAK